MSDASLIAAWLLDESDFVPTDKLLDLLTEQTIAVPAHWTTEVGNALRKAVRTGRLPQNEIEPMLDRLELLDLSISPPITIGEIAGLIHFSLEHGLSVYDAVYLRLASESQLALATLDSALRAAARRLNVALLPS